MEKAEQTAKTDGAIKGIVRSLLKSEENGFVNSPEHSAALAIRATGKEFSDGVAHYIQAYAHLDYWRQHRHFDEIAVGGDPVFSAGVYPNSKFGETDDHVLYNLSCDIANGCSSFLAGFDTDNGKPEERNIPTVRLLRSDHDKRYGVCWGIITEMEQYGGNFKRSLYPIEAFEKGREFLLSMVNFIYLGYPMETPLKPFFNDCHDWTREIFGDVDERGVVVNVREIKQGASK